VLATLSLVVVASDRRAMTSGAHEHGFLPGVLIEIAAPVQKLLSLPAELTRSGWGRYVALQGVRNENERLAARVAALEEENLQYREAIVSSERSPPAHRRDAHRFEAPMRPAQVVGQDVRPVRSVLVDRGGADGALGHAGRDGTGVVGLSPPPAPRGPHDAAARRAERRRRAGPALALAGSCAATGPTASASNSSCAATTCRWVT
jgi:hypothetical protein